MLFKWIVLALLLSASTGFPTHEAGAGHGPVHDDEADDDEKSSTPAPAPSSTEAVTPEPSPSTPESVSVAVAVAIPSTTELTSTSTSEPSTSESAVSVSFTESSKDKNKDEVTSTSEKSEGSGSTDQPKSDDDPEPANPDLSKFRLDEDTQKFIRLGTTKHCPTNMRFFAVQNSPSAGKCDCDYYQCSRPLLYSPKTKECHFAWSRGPCEDSEWYAFDAELKPVCEPRKCAQGLAEEPVSAASVSLSFWFSDPTPGGDGLCHEASSDDTCADETHALLIFPGDPIPKCRATTVCVPLGRPEPQLCFKGNRKYYDGQCP